MMSLIEDEARAENEKPDVHAGLCVDSDATESDEERIKVVPT